MAMDLKRAALGYHRKSFIMAGKFLDEAMKRKEEAVKDGINSYLNSLFNKLDNSVRVKDNEKKAEEVLMYSILIQNFAICQNISRKH